MILICIIKYDQKPFLTSQTNLPDPWFFTPKRYHEHPRPSMSDGVLPTANALLSLCNEVFFSKYKQSTCKRVIKTLKGEPRLVKIELKLHEDRKLSYVNINSCSRQTQYHGGSVSCYTRSKHHMENDFAFAKIHTKCDLVTILTTICLLAVTLQNHSLHFPLHDIVQTSFRWFFVQKLRINRFWYFGVVLIHHVRLSPFPPSKSQPSPSVLFRSWRHRSDIA